MSSRSPALADPLYPDLLHASPREPQVLARRRAESAGTAEARMQVSPGQGRFMPLLVRLPGVRYEPWHIRVVA